MADDLDAFFDEVSEVEAKAKDEEVEEDGKEGEAVASEELEPPPAKKAKTSSSSAAAVAAAAAGPPKAAAAPAIPRGVVVAAAASSSAVTATSKATAAGAGSPNGAAVAADGVLNAGHGAVLGSSAPLPPQPLPPPPPPPPPPLPAEPQQQPNSQNLDDWPSDGFRLFVGNLSNEVNDPDLFSHFAGRYPSLQRARIIREPKKQASRGYGFVSFADALECARAKREMDQTWLASRPIRIKKYQGQQGGGAAAGGSGANKKRNNKKRR